MGDTARLTLQVDFVRVAQMRKYTASPVDALANVKRQIGRHLTPVYGVHVKTSQINMWVMVGGHGPDLHFEPLRLCF